MERILYTAVSLHCRANIEYSKCTKDCYLIELPKVHLYKCLMFDMLNIP